MSRGNLCLWLVCLLLLTCFSVADAEGGRGRGKGKHHRSPDQAGTPPGTPGSPGGAGGSKSHDEDRGPLSKIPKQWLEGTIEMASDKGAAEAQKFLWLKDVSGVMYQISGGQALERLRKEAVGQHVFVWARSWTNERGEKCLKVSQFEKAVGTLPTEAPKHHRRSKEKQSAASPETTAPAEAAPAPAAAPEQPAQPAPSEPSPAAAPATPTPTAQ